jgi:hypothetical protein
MSGTSMASPHAAGVAALVLASNPGMTPAEIRQRLKDTADDLGASGWDVEFGYGLVDADEAATAGPVNAPPSVAISSPADGARVDSGASVTLQGSAMDTEDGSLTSTLRWSSNLDGSLGTGGSVTKVLRDGVHTITSSATDSGGRTGSDSITVTVAPQASGVLVSSITYARSGGKTRTKNLVITSTVKNNLGNVVSGATVTLVVTNQSTGVSSTLSAVSDATGKAVVSWRNAPIACYKSVVNKVAASGLTWDGMTPANSYCSP